jgi:hypothetical protein
MDEDVFEALGGLDAPNGLGKRVVRANKSVCDSFVREVHYSKRPSIFWAGFALCEGVRVTGVCVFGQPSPPIQKHSFLDRDFNLYELSRLAIKSEDRNAASFLVGNALKRLERPCAVVSYADSSWGHSGIVYQATNWLFTGSTKSHDHLYLVDGVRTHPMTLRDRGVTSPKDWAKENGIQTLPPEPKHRYFYLCGDRKQKREMLHKLRYPVSLSNTRNRKKVCMRQMSHLSFLLLILFLQIAEEYRCSVPLVHPIITGFRYAKD